MRKHTTVDLDADLVREAADALGTSTVTATIHGALAEVVRARRRLELLDAEIGLTLGDLEGLRSHRFVEPSTADGALDGPNRATKRPARRRGR